MTIRPDPRVADLVATAGGLALAAGLAVSLHLSTAPLVRAAVAVAWLVAGGIELARFQRAVRRYRAVRFDAGLARGICRNGMTESVAPLPGTVVTARFAWLRLRTPDGRPALVALTRQSAGSEAWRRLRVQFRLPA